MRDVEIITDLAERIRLLDQEIESAAQTAIDRIVECGTLLIEAREKHPYGQWLPFLQRAGMSAQRAQRYMRIASNTSRVTHLESQRAALEHLTSLTIQARLSEKIERRTQREQELGEKIKALPDKRYGVILADPPWRMEPYSWETGGSRSPANHYATTTTADLVSHKPPVSNDAVLFLWATAPMLTDALWLMDQWGFEYRSQIIWKKDRIGTGYWARNLHELLLIGAQGNIPAPAPGDQPNSVIDAPVGMHSVKPAVFHEIIERLFPSLPKLEMYQRSSRPGWDGWGAEAPEIAAA